ncbi:hypothetical protein CALCODRAFT_512062 [Calocera cornea HHB12733]|uniref:Uncharacterized protein n=1 Tax=Calocera cornea HHB12733 TaxID=1353952 RepID=A0A165DB33_9BASI|nr:hypothetical protein CALCODRAFT_512062 [Calocera cornea HHB12733]
MLGTRYRQTSSRAAVRTEPIIAEGEEALGQSVEELRTDSDLTGEDTGRGTNEPPRSRSPRYSSQTPLTPPRSSAASSEVVLAEGDAGVGASGPDGEEPSRPYGPSDLYGPIQSPTNYFPEDVLDSQDSTFDPTRDERTDGGWEGAAAMLSTWSGLGTDTAQSQPNSGSTPDERGPTSDLVIKNAMDAAPGDYPGRCSILVLMTGFGTGPTEKYLIRHARLDETVYRIDDGVMRTRVDVVMDIVLRNVTPRRGWATYKVCHELWLSRVPAPIHEVDNRLHGGWWLSSARDAIQHQIVTARGISSVLVTSTITRRFVLEHLRMVQLDEFLFVLCFELLKENPLLCGDPVPVGQEATGAAGSVNMWTSASSAAEEDVPLLSASVPASVAQPHDQSPLDRPSVLSPDGAGQEGTIELATELRVAARGVQGSRDPQGYSSIVDDHPAV